MADATPGSWRAPLDQAARELYLAVLRGGGTVEAAVAQSQPKALRRLVEVGLLVPPTDGGGYTAVSPRAVTVRIGAEMRAKAVGLLIGSEQVTDQFDDLIQAYDQCVPVAAERSVTVEHLDGLEAVQRRISQVLSECQSELIAVQPGHRSPQLLDIALKQHVPFLQRGGTLRTIFQPSALAAPAMVCYAAEVTRHGGAVRVLDEPFRRTVILDRRVAVIPTDEDTTVAVFLEDPAVVSHLVHVFERDWARAECVQWSGLRGAEPTGQTLDRVGALLSQGLTQQGMAKRLGISERTVAGHIARLRNRYGARTLYQLGWLMRSAAPGDGEGEERQ